MTDTKKPVAVGDWVQWNGSASRSHPRMYRGQVIAVRALTADVVDDEWMATNEVELAKLAVIAAPEGQASMTAAQCAECAALLESSGRVHLAKLKK